MITDSTSIVSMSFFDGAEAVIRSLLSSPAANSPLAIAVAIFPAPINPTEDTLRDISLLSQSTNRQQTTDRYWRHKNIIIACQPRVNKEVLLRGPNTFEHAQSVSLQFWIFFTEVAKKWRTMLEKSLVSFRRQKHLTSTKSVFKLYKEFFET